MPEEAIEMPENIWPCHRL